jgi:hypothetical protein
MWKPKLKTLNAVNNGYPRPEVVDRNANKRHSCTNGHLTYDQIREGLLESENFKYQDRKEFQFLELNKKLNEYNIKRYKLTYALLLI